MCDAAASPLMCPPYFEVVLGDERCGRPSGAIHVYTIGIVCREEVLEFKHLGCVWGGGPPACRGGLRGRCPGGQSSVGGGGPGGTLWRRNRSHVVKMDIWPVAMRVCPMIGRRPRLRRRPCPIHFSMVRGRCAL